MKLSTFHRSNLLILFSDEDKKITEMVGISVHYRSGKPEV